MLREALEAWDVQSIRQYSPDGVFPTLSANSSSGQNRAGVCYTLNTIDRPAICFKPGQGAKARSMGESERVAPTLGSEAGGNAVSGICYPNVFHTLTAHNSRNPESAQKPNCVCYDARGNGDGACCPTLTGDHENRMTDYTAVCVMAHGQSNAEIMQNLCPTINCNHEQPIVVYGGKPPRKYIIRRLTLLECCRLQGFPDWWEEGVEGSDTARYKMWGNGMALPCVLYVMQGIVDCKDKEN